MIDGNASLAHGHHLSHAVIKGLLGLGLFPFILKDSKYTHMSS